MDTERRRALRGALARVDGAAVVAAVEAIDLERFLQFAGDALLIALRQGVSGARPSAERALGSFGSEAGKATSSSQ
ncbi:MAG: hypothetical protein JO086_08770 [Acidimicrobiia bacterium]|nr:hypothetical protein [Acidimicrobiia bacterium]